MVGGTAVWVVYVYVGSAMGALPFTVSRSRKMIPCPQFENSTAVRLVWNSGKQSFLTACVCVDVC